MQNNFSPAGKMLALLLVNIPLMNSCWVDTNSENLQPAQLFVELPDFCPTPDAFALAPDGSITLSCPNYAEALTPGAIVRIADRENVSLLAIIPGITDSTWSRPMGIAYGNDGSLYVCDNQGKGKGRLLKLTFSKDSLVNTEVVAYGFDGPNGLRYNNGFLYLTQPMLRKFKTKKITSGVYRFSESDRNIEIRNDSTDSNLIFTAQTQNKKRQFGLDGLEFDAEDNLLVGDFGDGTIYKLILDEESKVIKSSVYAELPDSTGIDGMVMDSSGNLYVAGFSQNQLYKITPTKDIVLLAQYADNNGEHGMLDQPVDLLIYQNKLVISNFDLMSQPGMVNKSHDKPYTISFISLEDL